MNHPLVTTRVDATARPARRLPLSAAPSRPSRVLPSDELLASGRELVIRHEGAEYFLRLTRNTKLILTK